MLFLTILLALSLLGLLALFGLKASEERGKKIPFLPWLRSRGDEPATRHMKRAVRFVMHDAHVAAGAFVAKSRARLIAAEVAALSFTHSLAARIHQRLLHRKRRLSNENGAVSAHLKDMLEYKKEVPPKD